MIRNSLFIALVLALILPLNADNIDIGVDYFSNGNGSRYFTTDSSKITITNSYSSINPLDIKVLNEYIDFKITDDYFLGLLLSEKKRDGYSFYGIGMTNGVEVFENLSLNTNISYQFSNEQTITYLGKSFSMTTNGWFVDLFARYKLNLNMLNISIMAGASIDSYSNYSSSLNLTEYLIDVYPFLGIGIDFGI